METLINCGLWWRNHHQVPFTSETVSRGAHLHEIWGGGVGELDCGTDFPNSDIQI